MTALCVFSASPARLLGRWEGGRRKHNTSSPHTKFRACPRLSAITVRMTPVIWLIHLSMLEIKGFRTAKSISSSQACARRCQRRNVPGEAPGPSRGRCQPHHVPRGPSARTAAPRAGSTGTAPHHPQALPAWSWWSPNSASAGAGGSGRPQLGPQEAPRGCS